MQIAKFHFIEYAFDRNGLITPVTHFEPVKIGNGKINKIEMTFADLHQLPVNPGQSLVLDDQANVVSIIGSPLVNIPVPSKCPCCKKPIDNTLENVQCTNTDCPEKFPSSENRFPENKTFEVEKQFGSLPAIRYSASQTNAIVYRRNAHCRKAMIHWTSNSQLDHTFYVAGLIYSK